MRPAYGFVDAGYVDCGIYVCGSRGSIVEMEVLLVEFYFRYILFIIRMAIFVLIK